MDNKQPKRYFWLKLQHDFFTSKRIKKLRSLAGGDTYTIIYLKLQLLSIKTDGYIRFEHLEKTFAEELALDIDEKADDIQVVLSYLQSCGLLETGDDDTFFLPYVAENLGMESASAERVRRFRVRQKEEQLALQCNASVTQVKRMCNGEIEKEKEEEIEESKIKRKTEKKKFADANEIAYPNDPVLDNAFRDYVLMRAEIKKPLTEHARDLQIKHLNELSGGDSDKAIKILEQSTRNCWSDLYAIKENKADTGKVNWDQV